MLKVAMIFLKWMRLWFRASSFSCLALTSPPSLTLNVLKALTILKVLNVLNVLNILKVLNLENDVATKMHKNVVESKFITTFAS